MKNFDDWNQKKKNLDGLAYGPFCKEGEVWFTSIGLNIGDEEDGKNMEFERPVLVLRKFNKNIFVGVPLSSVAKPNNKYYVTIRMNGKEASVIISQVRLYSAKRLRRRMAIIDNKQLLSVVRAAQGTMSPIKLNKKRTLANQGPRGPKAFVPIC